MFKLNIKNFIIFCMIWGTIGFVLGTEILMGPSRWIVNIARNNTDLAWIEGPAIRTMILLLISVSLPVALFVTRTVLLSKRVHQKIVIPLILALFLGSTLFMWFNPKKFGNAGEEAPEATGRFTVGPYPDIEKIEELKADGYTALVSLLHPAVVPFETSLIAREKANAEQVGIEMIHLPMLPWISDNRESLKQLRELTMKDEGKYYLHCYLGKDRVSVATRTIADADPATAGTFGSRARKLIKRHTLERGRVLLPDTELYITPYPTHEEYFSYIIGANIKNVVCLMDPTKESDRKIITNSAAILSAYGIEQINSPISRENYDPEDARKAVDTVRSLEGSTVVFDFRCPSFRTEAFIQSYRDSRPALPPSFMQRKFLAGKLQQVAPNVVTGPRPDSLKKVEDLERLGITRFLYIGKDDNEDAVNDRTLAMAAQFSWQSAAPDLEAVTSLLGTGGPWYIYGPGTEKFIKQLKREIGPAYREPPDHVALFNFAAAGPAASPRFDSTLKSIKNNTGPDTLNPITIGLKFLMNSTPDLKMLILFSPFCLLYTYICACFAGWLRAARNVRVSYTRKVFHFTIFTTACIVQAAGGLPATVLYGGIVCSCVMYAILRGDDFPFYEAMARSTDRPHRSLYIFIPMVTTALGGVISNILFGPAAIVGYLVGGWGDAVGEPAGSRWGKHKYKVFSLFGVPATRSIEGSTAVMAASFLAAFTGLLIMGAPLGLAWSIAALCAIAACLTEALSTHGLDNLTVQVAACAVIYFLLKFTA